MPTGFLGPGTDMGVDVASELPNEAYSPLLFRQFLYSLLVLLHSRHDLSLDPTGQLKTMAHALVP